MIGTGRNMHNKAKNEYVLFPACYFPSKNVELQVHRGCFPEVWPLSSEFCSDRAATHELQHTPGAKAGFVIC